MDDGLSFRVGPTDAARAGDASGFVEFVGELVTEGLAWRAGLAVGELGPTVGPDASSDIVYRPQTLIGLARHLVDPQLLDERQDDQSFASTVGEPWVWLREAVSGRSFGEESDLVRQALESGFDSTNALRALDEVVEAVIGWWVASPEGANHVTTWAVAREVDRRVTEKRLAGLRRRYDRDLLVLADKIADLSAER